VLPPIRRLAFSLLRIYVVILVLVACLQRKLLFFPTRSDEPHAIAAARHAGLEPWRDANGKLIGWRCGKSGANKLLVFHGNAGSAVNRSYYADGFCPLDGGRQWDVWICEYPGYGARAGSPGRKAFADAARSAARQLTAMDARPLFVLGESIGSGVACDLAASEPKLVRGLILVTPFARLADVAAEKFPFLPVKYLLRDRWDNVAALAECRVPVAVLIAGRDEVVGTRQGELLFEKIAGKKKRWDFPEATHNSEDIFAVTPWAGEVSDFLMGR
jgi:pimeloyl-ACP methyl ester carboxylesterase